MGDEQKTNEKKDSEDQKKVWLLVDHSSREASLVPVAQQLEDRGFSVELVTITEVISSVAREALAGGAERLLRGLRVAVKGGGSDEDLIGAIRRRQPDVLVVTEPRYVRGIGVLENLTGVESLQVGLVPDFHIDEGWFSGQLHAFIVPDDQLRDDIVDRGATRERVRIGGPALRPSFRRSVDAEEARKELGIGDEQRQVVLVRADGFDAATLEKLVFQSTLCDRDVRYIFHHDGHGATASTLRRAAEQYGLPAAMFGRVSDLERYFAAIDATLAAEDDPYLAEILQSKTPALLISKAGAAGNGEALAGRKIVDHLDDIGQLGTRLDRFLAPDSIEELSAALDDWDGASRHDRLVDALEEVANCADEWRKPAAPKTSHATEQGDDDKKEQELGGRFESIGARTPSSDSETQTGDEGVEPKSHDYSNLSRAEAKEQLAQLILKERDHERRLQELEKQQERWQGRLQLAREWKETELEEEAKSILRGYIEEAKPLEQELNDIRRQKQKLKTASRAGAERGDDGRGSGRPKGSDESSEEIEERFQQMEVDRDLEGLKDRIRRELGE